MTLAAGTRLGPYEILSPLGEGGMGEVYLAEDPRLDRRVAIKVLPADSMADPQARKRLVREAQAAARLDHPNICAIYEVSEDAGTSFIVMQYVEGDTLASRLHLGPLDLRQAITVATQTAEALAEAHSRGIIHRDIKPQNIMIASRGQVKVMDFGLAKAISAPAALESQADTDVLLTERGMIVGTVPYMSPEQLRNEPLDARSDIFSFGAVLYEMVSGRQPFADASTATTIAAVLTREPPPLGRRLERGAGGAGPDRSQGAVEGAGTAIPVDARPRVGPGGVRTGARGPHRRVIRRPRPGNAEIGATSLFRAGPSCAP